MAIIGPTNAGKSTLINQIMGRKVSIVSHKVQTTRTRIRAVKMIDHPAAQTRGTPPQEGNLPTQLIFVDTPGVFKPARRLDRAMVGAAMDSIGDADALLLIVDATHGVTPTVREIIKKLSITENLTAPPLGGADGKAVGGGTQQSESSPHRPAKKRADSPQGGSSKPLFAVINKTDAVKKPNLLPIAAELTTLAPFREIFMASALRGDGLDKMMQTLADVMPESPYLFDPADASDVPDELYLAELTREKVYQFVHQELPYHIHVVTEKVDTADDGVLEIYQKIVVNSDNHKKIVIGRGGTQLQQIGTAARHDIQNQWGVNARLHLFVRVEPDWEDKRENYEEQGL
ncbi:MAG: GTPase Era, partial [Proteobacteria bacterium]|nr:GTPase Era [Pseudomonadota bacterium]